MTGSQRILQLDVLRGIAILLVLGRHAPFRPKDAGHFEGIAAVWATIGWAGVELFFVLSGFLIGGLLFQEIKSSERLDVRRFLIRRAFKIWPTYFAYLVFVFFYAAYVLREGPPSEIGAGLAANWLHFQNYFGSIRIHTWSLAVEEHFYLALPFLLVWLVRRGRLHTLVATGIGLLIVSLVVRSLVVASMSRYTPLATRYPTHLQIDLLMLGVVLAYLFHFHPEVTKRAASRRGAFYAAALALFGSLNWMPLHEGVLGQTLGHTAAGLGSAALLIALLHTPLTGAWERAGRVVGGIGIYSYAIYVWHVDLSLIPMRKLLAFGFMEGGSMTIRWALGMLIYGALAIVPAMILARLIEMPALAFRDRLFPARARAVPAVEPTDPGHGTEPSRRADAEPASAE